MNEMLTHFSVRLKNFDVRCYFNWFSQGVSVFCGVGVKVLCVCSCSVKQCGHWYRCLSDVDVRTELVNLC